MIVARVSQHLRYVPILDLTVRLDEACGQLTPNQLERTRASSSKGWASPEHPFFVEGLHEGISSHPKGARWAVWQS